MRSYTFVFLGNTGTGKSNLSNFISNFKLNFKVGEDLKSETTESRLGKFIDEDGTEFQVIDTPGFLDSQGEEVEKKNLENINQFLSNTTRIGTVFVLSSFQSKRVDFSFLNSLKELCRMFPLKDFWNHFAVIWTNYIERNERIKVEKKKKFDTQFMEIIKPVLEEMNKELGIEIPNEIKMFYGDFFMEDRTNPETINCLQEIKAFIKSNKPLYKNITEEVFSYDKKQKVGEPIILENIETQKYEIFTLVTFEDFNELIPPIHKKYNVIQWNENIVHQRYQPEPELQNEKDPKLGDVLIKKYKIVEKLVIENEDNKGGVREEITDKVLEQWEEKEYWEVQPEQFDHEVDYNEYYTEKYYKTIKKKVYINRYGTKKYGNENEEVEVSKRNIKVPKPVRYQTIERTVYKKASPPKEQKKEYRKEKCEKRDNGIIGDLKRLGAHVAVAASWLPAFALGTVAEIASIPFDRDSTISKIGDTLMNYSTGEYHVHDYISNNIGTIEGEKLVEVTDKKK